MAAVVTLVATAASVSPLAAQRAPALGGAEVRVGLTFPQEAQVAPRIFGEADLGYFLTPPLRLLAGLSVYEANIDREGGGNEGFFRATGLWLSGRYDLLSRRDLAPYLRIGLTLQRVTADAFDRDVDALLPGTYVGVAAGVGARHVLDRHGRLSATAEIRRTALTNVANTALELGVRIQRRGFQAYDRDWSPIADRRPVPAPTQPGAPAPVDPAAALRLAELERLAREAERELAAARDAAARGAFPAAPAPVVPDPAVREPAVPEPAIGDHAARDPAAVDPATTQAMLRQSLSRAAGAMESLVGLEETAADFVVTLASGAFPTGAAALAGPARDEVRILATVLAGYPGHIMSVEGHTDSVGDAAANQLLSERRAAAVRAALIAEGADPLWISARGFGEQRPVASNQTAAGRAANRRVEIRVFKTFCAAPPLAGPGGVLECRL
jgi:outer membrane protein OmpA-like peptidoglycan-associated protein